MNRPLTRQARSRAKNRGLAKQRKSFQSSFTFRPRVEVLESRRLLSTLQLKLESGTTTVLVQDNGPGDSDATAGSILFVGSIENFTTQVSAGLSKPVVGGPSVATIKGNSSSINSTGGTITISLTDTGFALTPSTGN